MDVSGDSVDKDLPAKAGDMGLIPDQRRSQMSRGRKPVHHY